MSERCCGQREACRVCGSSEWREAHFNNGIVCLPCWREIERSKRKTPPAQQSLDLVPQRKPRPAQVHIPEPERWGDPRTGRLRRARQGDIVSENEKPPARLLEAVPAVSENGQIPSEDENDGEGLSALEIRFVDALATGTTPREAAKLVGVSERTGRRWRQKPEIQAAIRSRLNDSIAVGRSILASGMASAAAGLVSMASGEAKADPGRASACRAVTEGAVKLTEIQDLQVELTEIREPTRCPAQPQEDVIP